MYLIKETLKTVELPWFIMLHVGLVLGQSGKWTTLIPVPWIYFHDPAQNRPSARTRLVPLRVCSGLDRFRVLMVRIRAGSV